MKRKYNLEYGADLICGFVENPDLIRVVVADCLARRKERREIFGEDNLFKIRTSDGYSLKEQSFWDFVLKDTTFSKIVRKYKLKGYQKVKS